MSDLSPDEAEIEASRAPLLDHLIELRNRLVICVVALFVAFVLCFSFRVALLDFLVQPSATATNLFIVQQQSGGEHKLLDLQVFKVLFGLAPAPQTDAQFEMQVTGYLERFYAYLHISALGAIALTFPILAWQLYRFVAPGLYRKERGAFLPFLFASPILFVAGAALVYYVMMPFLSLVALNMEADQAKGVKINLDVKLSEHLKLITGLLFAFGISFQLPVILSLLGLAGMIGSEQLKSFRRFAIVGVAIVAALITPPDPFSMLILTVPLVLLYEASIWCVWLIERRRKKEEE